MQKHTGTDSVFWQPEQHLSGKCHKQRGLLQQTGRRREIPVFPRHKKALP